MRRKVSLARALIKKPQILLMDEPFVSLDQPTAENLYSRANKLLGKKTNYNHSYYA